MLYNWDAVQFALALREFDVAKHQPHPPGYFLYVGLGRLLNASLGDPTLAYVALAMLFSAGSTFVVYRLAGAVRSANRPAAAALLAVSPLFWFYGSVGLTYAGRPSAPRWWPGSRGRPHGDRRAPPCRGRGPGPGGGLRPSVVLLLFRCGSALSRGHALAPGARPGVACSCSRSSPGSCPGYGCRAAVGLRAAPSHLYASVVLPTSVLGGSLEIPSPSSAISCSRCWWAWGRGDRGIRPARVHSPRGLRRPGLVPAAVDLPAGAVPPWCTSGRRATCSRSCPRS
jgi:hypothetical protein